MEVKKVNNDELLRMWVESKETPTREFSNKIVEWAKVIFDKRFGDKGYVTDRQLEWLLTDVTINTIKFRNKFQEENGTHIYSYFNTVITSFIIRELHSSDSVQVKIKKIK
tara:strand:+ start:8549 stop:8878 length:330 start_codon:yes stop_codon:yes gene_type:complete